MTGPATATQINRSCLGGSESSDSFWVLLVGSLSFYLPHNNDWNEEVSSNKVERADVSRNDLSCREAKTLICSLMMSFVTIGGGLGGSRRGGPDVNARHSGREDRDRERDDRSNSRRRSKSRDRSRERRRRKSRSRSRDRDRKRARRSRSKDRERKRSRSHDRDRDRKRRRSRSPRRDRERGRGRGENGPWPEPDPVKDEPKQEVDYDEFGYNSVKQEPEDRKPRVDHNSGRGYDEY